jgi:hypothetical protein
MIIFVEYLDARKYPSLDSDIAFFIFGALLQANVQIIY